ncbi:hypothetical protein [Ilumatobacter sp.]|uniref:hypothetical protein n=1 Tax=Ilumatobacter sp. TaxID=1967498 RepID=UPI003AF6FC01
MVAEFEVVEGVEMIRIDDVDALAPFLMTIVSSSDLWMFISSSGGLTAGRVDRDRCLFPYETDDRLHMHNDGVGTGTVLRVRDGASEVLWEPWRGHARGVRRSLLKSVLGDAIVFEEHHLETGLTIRSRWAPSERFGWVRTVALHHGGSRAAVTVDVVDGLLGVMPAGIDALLQQRMSNLANAYRRSEIADPGIGIFSLEAMIVDRPEPAEALRATTVWTTGLDGSATSLDPAAIDDARLGRPFRPSSLRTGRPGSFLVHATLDLAPGERHRWHLVADVAQDHADIERLRTQLEADRDANEQDTAVRVDDDIRRSSATLHDIVAGADAFQLTASPVDDAHHLANTLFNVMRGGTFMHGDTIDAERFRTFVRERNRTVSARRAEQLADLPASFDVSTLRAHATRTADPDLVRLAHEYLPLMFSRRHGDPSRPWNQFSIRVLDDDGEPVVGYQGNWRDIFQNWEALARSFPAFLPSIIAKFLNASTTDGFNPYRITDEGIDWEVVDPADPWSGIGYWGDHQIVYLDRLLRAQDAHDPDWLATSLGDRAYAFADVPYRIVPFDELVADPKSTVDYDTEAEAAVAARVESIGSDGRLVADADGQVVHVTLLEKLLIPALAKMSNFVPRGGIWMNTQRPEWNDANNALVGHGLSMVTLAHLRRYVQLLDRIASDPDGSLHVSDGVLRWMASISATLESFDHLVGAAEIDASDRAAMLRELGVAYGSYRAETYATGPSTPAPLRPDALGRFTSAALRHLDDAVRSGRRADGLYHAYNVIEFSPDGRRADVDHLPPMLEGQVAAISSGLLDSDDVVELVESMYDSPLYRPDIDSFLLYPARRRPSFLDRNLVPSEAVATNPLLAALVDGGSEDIIVRDVSGRHHFNADFRNAADLRGALDRLDAVEASLVDAHRERTLELFEQVFAHHRFTGRSSTMYGYEGIGSVYWHMVAKLLVAVQEHILTAPGGSDDRLVGLYGRIRGGFGFNKTADEYGAFPTDPYSHTPAHAGAQQPGMTGQVKEELLTRWAELGLVVADGRLGFTPRLVSSRTLRSEAGVLSLRRAGEAPRHVDVPAGGAAFTVCGVPVVVHGTEGATSIVVTHADGSELRVDGPVLDRSTSGQIFDRVGDVARLDVTLGPVIGGTTDPARP